MFLESQDPDKDISLYINSPGGSVTAGFAIFDTMNFIKCDVSTICIGLAKRLNQLLAQNAGRTIEEIERDTDRDNFMTAEEAKAYGIIDSVISKREFDKTK